jgi:[acyl-carrier-protein] S-malonyltransferase
LKRFALLCPGQGAQSVGMGSDFYNQFPVAAQVYDSADEILKQKISHICFKGPEDLLQATDNAQAAIFVTSVAIYRVLESLGKVPEPPAAYAGLSLGEYTALHLAAAVNFESTLKVVKARGQLMQAAAEADPSTMLALVGADEAAAAQICQQAQSAGIIVAANFNAPGQIVLSGSKDACAKAAQIATDMGIRSVPLNVAGAFHSPLMRKAADAMSVVLEPVDLHLPIAPVISNVTAQPHGTSPLEIKLQLVNQIVAPVRWQQSMETLQRDGFEEFLEIGPGRTLSGLMRKINRKAKVTNISTVADIEALV